ncbi:MAG: class I SAM-dependent methyltransferase [Chitinophagaceae bacterium]|nr:class I SAM-dependent methyltransferase [Chitinophagaceae bacterium]
MAAKLRWKIAQWAERKWWQIYLKNKKTSDYATWKIDYWTNFLEQCKPEISIQENHQILDAGCGPAGLFIALPNHQVTALDPLLDSYEKDLPHFKKSNYPNTTFITSSLEDFDLKNKFDVIFCLNAINHVSDISLAFDKLFQSTKPGAKMAISIDAHKKTFLKKIFQALPGDVLHPHQFDLKDYCTMIEEKNCNVLRKQLLKSESIFDYYLLLVEKK